MEKKAKLKLVINNKITTITEDEDETIYVDINENLLDFWQREREKERENEKKST